jgi:excisionase family DNA binding protein
MKTQDTTYMTTDEVADLVRTPTETVRYWRSIGTGPKSFKVGRRVLYARDDVEAWIKEARG